MKKRLAAVDALVSSKQNKEYILGSQRPHSLATSSFLSVARRKRTSLSKENLVFLQSLESAPKTPAPVSNTVKAYLCHRQGRKGGRHYGCESSDGVDPNFNDRRNKSSFLLFLVSYPAI
jgi:hypothetical protein